MASTKINLDKSSYPNPQPRSEVVKNKMRIDFRHCANIWNIMPHYYVGKVEECCRTVGEVTHH